LSDTHSDVCEGGRSPEERRAFAETLSRIGDKWTVLVVGVLAHGPMRCRQIFKRGRWYLATHADADVEGPGARWPCHANGLPDQSATGGL
jgi:hypothetical protein